MRRFTTALAAGLLAALAAACTDDDSAALDEEDVALKYAECMRNNGIDDFPDPGGGADSGGGGFELPGGVDPEDADFQSAADACAAYQPGADELDEALEPELYAALLDYSACMRDNGITDYPDPTPTSSVKADDLDAAGIDTDGEAYAAAEEACAEYRPALQGGDE